MHGLSVVGLAAACDFENFLASSTSADTAVRMGSPLLVWGHTSTPAIPSASPRYGSTLPILAKRTSSETCQPVPACTSIPSRQ
ncbi:hypothetical protein [Archangium lansingense]|uniref:Uncharacterized protein n=1 Tax=Archangium lansingense TaxID=2995310 RepID=A0ABT4A1M8_9BACT|nr:hypothetical protein [Archangium lansinium]MCY1075543.1 hypothetical protein [Archangium lansinium]